jgi:hypothetical protein
MKYLILAVLAITGNVISRADGASQPKDIRDLIILLDTDVETTPERLGAVMGGLVGALDQQTAPVLISAPLWCAFVEMHQEFQIHRKISGSNEAKAADLIDAINDRINYWYKMLNEQSKDAIQNKMLTIEHVNAEFYHQEAYKKLQDEKRLPDLKEAGDFLVACSEFITITFVPDEWYSLIIDNAYYLLIPKSYARQYTTSTDIHDVMHALNFSTSTGDICEDPLDTAWFLYTEFFTTDAAIVSTLTKLFDTKSIAKNKPQWCISMAGHGSGRSDFHIPNIAGMSWQTYQDVCSFLDSNLSMHSLWIMSCNAGGDNRRALFDSAGVSYRYGYPIILESLNDSATFSFNGRITFPNGINFLDTTTIHWHAGTNTWRLRSPIFNNYKKFFKYMHQIDNAADVQPVFSDNIINKAAAKLRSRLHLNNIPQLFLPGTCTSHLCYPEHAQRIDGHSALLAELCKKAIVVHKKLLFIDTPYIIQPLQIVDKMPEYTVSIMPGAATHYCAKLDAPKAYPHDVVESFWQLPYSSSSKLFLIDSLTCAIDSKDPFAQVIGATEAGLSVTNVMIRVIKNEQIRVVFTTASGATFTTQMRKLASDAEPVLRNLQPLSAKAAEAYTAYYTKLKEQCIQDALPAYTKLKDQYALALGIQLPQASVSDAAVEAIPAA